LKFTMASYFMDNAKIVVIVSLLILGIKTQCPSSGAICTSCIDGCDTCTDNSTCQTCSTQYYAVPIDNTSSLSTCSLCPTKCLVCSTPYVCDSCTPGYDPTTDNSTGYQYCTFIWWKWFLIVFGVLLGIVLIGIYVIK